jgi:hypothetical protein
MTREFPRLRTWLDSRNVDKIVKLKVSHACREHRTPAVQSVTTAKELPWLSGLALPIHPLPPAMPISVSFAFIWSMETMTRWIWNLSSSSSSSSLSNHHLLLPLIRSFDLFRHRRIATFHGASTISSPSRFVQGCASLLMSALYSWDCY